MIDLRPIGYIVGLCLVVLGALMLLPMALDWLAGDPNWRGFFSAAAVTSVAGGVMALASANAGVAGLSVRQAFVLTTAIWTVLPAFGALPFLFGAPGLGWTDAMFEAVSGLS
ncbi:MAG: potassium transporter TrkH, partial [Gemmobacter sp.]|nr:potassium transporter TrkH [Gemmobacter sp.]